MHAMICAFIEYLAEHIPAPATIKNKILHVRSFLRLAGAQTQGIDHPRVARAIEALHRNKQYTPNVKDPISMKDLRSVIFAIPQTPVGTAVRAAVLIMYFGALHQSEVALGSVRTFDQFRHPTRGGLRIEAGHITLKIKWAKNMQRVGQTRSIKLSAAPDTRLCPVAAMRQHLDHIPTACITDPLLMFTGSRDPVPLSTIRTVWEEALREVGADTRTLSLHSLRKAAATQADQAGCLEHQIQRLGGWSSMAYKAYVKQTSDTAVNQRLIQSIL